MLLYLNKINRPTGPLFPKEVSFELHWHATHLVLVVKQVEPRTSQGHIQPRDLQFQENPFSNKTTMSYILQKDLVSQHELEGGSFEAQGCLDALF